MQIWFWRAAPQSEGQRGRQREGSGFPERQHGWWGLAVGTLDQDVPAKS